MGYSVVLLARCCVICNAYTYAEIWRKTFGQNTEVIVHIAIFFCGYFACMAYCIFIGDFLEAAIDPYVSGDTQFLSNPWFIVPVVAAGILFPLCLSRELKSLRKFSLFGILS
eukprot:114616_1